MIKSRIVHDRLCREAQGHKPKNIITFRFEVPKYKQQFVQIVTYMYNIKS